MHFGIFGSRRVLDHDVYCFILCCIYQFTFFYSIAEQVCIVLFLFLAYFSV